MSASARRDPSTRLDSSHPPTRCLPITVSPSSCSRSARRRARGVMVVLDADRPTQICDELFRIATHVVFSSECLRATTGRDDLAAGLAAVAATTSAFLAVTHGPNDVLWREGGAMRKSPVFAVDAVDTLGAGDVFHDAFTLALAQGRTLAEAIRFAAAAAGLARSRLCSRGRPRANLSCRRKLF